MHQRAHDGRRSVGAACMVLATALAMVLAPSCGGSDPDDAPLLAAATQVVANGCRQRPTLGAGSFVGDGLVLTVAHVVAGSDDIRVHLADGRSFPAQVVGMDRKKDLAVLRVPDAGEDVQPIPIGRARPGESGEFVVWRDGRAVAGPFEIVSFVDINANDIDHSGPGLRKGFQITAEVDHGDSGSVMVSGGRAVGVVFARSTGAGDRAWATDIREALPLLDTAEDPVDVGDCAG